MVNNFKGETTIEKVTTLTTLRHIFCRFSPMRMQKKWSKEVTTQVTTLSLKNGGSIACEANENLLVSSKYFTRRTDGKYSKT
jgi:hypothetical protein